MEQNQLKIYSETYNNNNHNNDKEQIEFKLNNGRRTL